MKTAKFGNVFITDLMRDIFLEKQPKILGLLLFFILFFLVGNSIIFIFGIIINSDIFFYTVILTVIGLLYSSQLSFKESIPNSKEEDQVKYEISKIKFLVLFTYFIPISVAMVAVLFISKIYLTMMVFSLACLNIFYGLELLVVIRHLNYKYSIMNQL